MMKKYLLPSMLAISIAFILILTNPFKHTPAVGDCYQVPGKAFLKIKAVLSYGYIADALRISDQYMGTIYVTIEELDKQTNRMDCRFMDEVVNHGHQ